MLIEEDIKYVRLKKKITPTSLGPWLLLKNSDDKQMRKRLMVVFLSQKGLFPRIIQFIQKKKKEK
jgi:hypothetical protein